MGFWRNFISYAFLAGAIGIFGTSLISGKLMNAQIRKDLENINQLYARINQHYEFLKKEQNELFEEKKNVKNDVDSVVKEKTAAIEVLKRKNEAFRSIRSFDSFLGTLYSIDDIVDDIDKHTPADEIFERFPLELPGASSVKKHYAPGSNYCLVHIRQLHLGIVETEESLKKTENVHEDIYQIIRYLNENNNVVDVYEEGVTGTNIDIIRRIHATYLEQKQTLEGVERQISLAKKMAEQNPGDKECLDHVKRFEDLYANLSELLKKFPVISNDAVFRLYHEKKISIRPSEEEQVSADTSVLKTLCIGGKISKSAERLVMMEEREYAALRMISKDAGVMPVIVYGAGHDWRNNICEWNESNPDKRFSLIVITPKSYVE